jgi:hypothetical protein
MFIFSLTTALVVVGSQHHASTALTPGKRPGAHYTGGWMGPMASLGGCG